MCTPFGNRLLFVLFVAYRVAEHDGLRGFEFQRRLQSVLVHAAFRVGCQARAGAEEGDVLGDDSRIHRRPGFGRVRYQDEADGRIGRPGVSIADGNQGMRLVVVQIGGVLGAYIDFDVLPVHGGWSRALSGVGPVDAVGRPDEVGEVFLREHFIQTAADGLPVRQGFHDCGAARQVRLVQFDGFRRLEQGGSGQSQGNNKRKEVFFHVTEVQGLWYGGEGPPIAEI